ETGSSYARKGQMLPPYDTARTLQRMSAAVARHCPSRIISLGDSFHDPGGAQRLNEADKAVISSLAASAEFVWVTGNHDGDSAAALGGTACEHIEVEGVVFRHIPTEGTVQGCEVAGHLHPAAYVSIKGRTIRRRCFIGTDQRMIMPAFGCLTGGLSITDSAFAGLWPSAPRLHLIGSNRVYSL
ncbi:MAG: ligase-associated DNA damage response endonuclease PdeM, partial [Pseudomonadota bacterium]